MLALITHHREEVLGGDDEPVEAIEEEIADEADAQSDLLRWMAQPNAAPPPQQRPPRFQVSSSAVPVRTESRPRTGGWARGPACDWVATHS